MTLIESNPENKSFNDKKSTDLSSDLKHFKRLSGAVFKGCVSVVFSESRPQLNKFSCSK